MPGAAEPLARGGKRAVPGLHSGSHPPRGIATSATAARAPCPAPPFFPPPPSPPPPPPSPTLPLSSSRRSERARWRPPGLWRSTSRSWCSIRPPTSNSKVRGSGAPGGRGWGCPASPGRRGEPRSAAFCGARPCSPGSLEEAAGAGVGAAGGGRRRGGERARPPPSCDPAAAPRRPRPRQRRGPARGGHRARSAGVAAPAAPCHARVPAAGCRAAALLSAPPALSAAGRGGRASPG